MGGRRKTRKARKTRKMRGGNFYGFAGGVGNTSAGPQWNAVENVAANPVTGKLIPNDGSEMNATKLGGRRRKTTRKGGKHRKGHRRSRKMRGGANWVSVAPAGGAYTGNGKAGLISLDQYSSNMPVRGGPVQGPDGVYKA